jgi:hypothetical protein
MAKTFRASASTTIVSFNLSKNDGSIASLNISDGGISYLISDDNGASWKTVWSK